MRNSLHSIGKRNSNHKEEGDANVTFFFCIHDILNDIWGIMSEKTAILTNRCNNPVGQRNSLGLIKFSLI